MLLLVIYIAFIGLGIPDALFGPSWPVIHTEFNVPVSYGSYITMTVALGTVVSSFSCAKLAPQFGTKRIVFISTALTAVGIYGFSVSQSFWLLFLFAIALGLGGGAIDSVLNDYISLHYTPIHMNFLHAFYGVGVIISPSIISAMLTSGLSWRQGYRLAALLQLVITLITLFSFPLWPGAKTGSVKKDKDQEYFLSPVEVLKIPNILYLIIVLVSACGMEFILGSWGSSFLVRVKNFDPGTAARVIVFYYIGYSIARFSAGLLSLKIGSARIVKYCIWASLLGISIIFLSGGSFWGTCAGFTIAGFGIGPIFANVIYVTPLLFGEKYSTSIISTQMGFSYLGIMLLPALYGFMYQYITPNSFIPYLLVLGILCMVSFRKLRHIQVENFFT